MKPACVYPSPESPVSAVTSVRFSPDGTLLASGTLSGGLYLLSTAACPGRAYALSGHEGRVSRLSFSPQTRDGLLVSVGVDRQILLWDVDRRELLGRPVFVDSLITGVDFSPDGLSLYTADADGVGLWDMDVASWMGRACQRANRNMSLAEWQLFMGASIPYCLTCPGLPPGEGAQKDARACKDKAGATYAD
jgi:WD40 repeat protein